MDDAFLVGVFQRVDKLVDDRQRVGLRQGPGKPWIPRPVP